MFQTTPCFREPENLWPHLLTPTTARRHRASGRLKRQVFALLRLAVKIPAAACCSNHSRAYRGLVPVLWASSPGVSPAPPAIASALYHPSRSPSEMLTMSMKPLAAATIRSEKSDPSSEVPADASSAAFISIFSSQPRPDSMLQRPSSSTAGTGRDLAQRVPAPPTVGGTGVEHSIDLHPQTDPPRPIRN